MTGPPYARRSALVKRRSGHGNVVRSACRSELRSDRSPVTRDHTQHPSLGEGPVIVTPRTTIGPTRGCPSGTPITEGSALQSVCGVVRFLRTDRSNDRRGTGRIPVDGRSGEGSDERCDDPRGIGWSRVVSCLIGRRADSTKRPDKKSVLRRRLAGKLVCLGDVCTVRSPGMSHYGT